MPKIRTAGKFFSLRGLPYDRDHGFRLQPSLYERKKIAEGATSGAVTDGTIPNKSKGGGARRVRLSILSDSLAGGLQLL
jgi:hypothetical protein